MDIDQKITEQDQGIIDEVVNSIMEAIKDDLKIEELDPEKLKIHDVVFEDNNLMIDYDYEDN